MSNFSKKITELISRGKTSILDLSEEDKRVCVACIMRDEIHFNEAGCTLSDDQRNNIFLGISYIIEKRQFSLVDIMNLFDDIFLGDCYDDVIREALEEEINGKKFNYFNNTKIMSLVSGDSKNGI